MENQEQTNNIENVNIETQGQKTIGLEDFLQDFQAPKEPFDEIIKETIPGQEKINLPGAEKVENTPGEIKTDILPNPGSERKTQLEAKMIVSIFDGGVGKVCQFLAQAESSRKYRAEPEEKDDLTLLLAEYLKESGGKVPVWILLLILAGSIYGPNIYLAYQEGREKGKPKPKQPEKPISQNVEFGQVTNEPKVSEQTESFTFEPIKTDIVEVKVRSCKNCGKELKNNQKLYCGNICKNRANGQITGNKKRGKRKPKPKNINTYEILPG